MSDDVTKTNGSNGSAVPGGSANGANAPIVKLSTSALARARRREEKSLPTLETDERSLDKEKLVAWILDKSDPVHKKRQCHLFVLSHDHRLSGLTTMTEELLPKSSSPAEREAFARRIVDDFDEESRNTADQHPVFQRFVVTAAKGDDREKEEDAPIATKSFNVSPRPETAAHFHQAAAKTTSDIDVTSIVGTMQRNNELHVRQLTETMGSMQDRLIDWNTRVMEQNEKIESERFRMRVEMEDLLDRKIKREIDAEHQKLLNTIYYKGFEMVSSIGEQVMAKKLGIGADGPLGQLANFMKVLEPMQFIQIYAMLSPEQQKAFAPIAPKIVAAMGPEKQAVLGPLLQQYQQALEGQTSPEPALAEAKKEGEK